MTPIERSILQAIGFIESLQRQKDDHLRTMTNADASAIQRAFASERVKLLDDFIGDAKNDLEHARRLQFRPAFSLPAAMLRAGFPRRKRERKLA